ncbi:MAG TPA: glycosyltransferase family 4 protein [Chloroflexota bacterium]|nr:glycosyltransferase family 4 protein [Chloroflexota bacterium]
MRIALASPPWERVPPPAYGGIEAVVSLLADGLVRRGHDVTLYATGDSLTMARLKWVCPRPLRVANVDQPLPYQLVHTAALLTDADQYDLIHNHCGEFLMAFSRLTRAPMLTTIHGPMHPDTRIIWDHYTGYHNSISTAAHDGFPDVRYLGVVYNGVDVDSFPYSATKDDFLLFLGRISEEKGTHLAIEVAKTTGRRLIIAGKIDRVDREYYERKVAPSIDGTQIMLFGEADADEKRRLFAHAHCLLHPITWPEPFGLVMAEAMACGTPVIAFRRGSVPEVIRDGETGFIVDTLDEMADAISRVDQIDPARCRAHVANLFSADQMIAGYERLYQTVCASALSQRHAP